MFETSVISVQARPAERRYGLLTLSVAAHAAIITAIVGASLASVTLPNQAPNQMSTPFFRLAPALGTPDAKPAQPKQPTAQPQVQKVPVPQIVTAPQTIPQTTEPAATTASTSTGGNDAQASGSTTGDSGTLGVPWGQPNGVGVDGPPVTEIVQPAAPIRVFGDVKAPVVLRRVQPIYPRAAMAARMAGFVIVECIIDRNGVVRDAKVIKSSTLLFDQSALDAVQQWQFTPGSLHGQAVDVIFDLTVRFEINR